jgi:hypothetical protein
MPASPDFRSPRSFAPSRARGWPLTTVWQTWGCRNSPSGRGEYASRSRSAGACPRAVPRRARRGAADGRRVAEGAANGLARDGTGDGDGRGARAPITAAGSGLRGAGDAGDDRYRHARQVPLLVKSHGRALRYSIGVGRPAFEWAGVKRVSRKAEWPDWTPPPRILLRRPDLPRHMDGGPDSPLGARASISAGPRSTAPTAPTSHPRSATASHRAASG